jgi:drug/metabolite transporter (DMT)-like permease
MHLIFILYALFASIFTIGKYSLEHAQPFFIIGSRMTIAGLLMLAYIFWKKRSMFRCDSFSWVRLIILAIFNIYLTNACEFWGLQYLSSSKTCLLYSISPFVSVILSYIILSETLSRQKWLGLVIGFLGFIPILLSNSAEEEALGSFFLISWPELAILGAASFSVYGWVLLRQLATQKNLSPIFINGISMFLGGLITLCHSYAIEDWNPVPVYNGIPFLETLIAMMIISNGICYNLYGFLLKKYTAPFLSFAGFLTPIFAALFGFLFLHETISWHFWTSLSIIIVSLTIFHHEEVKKGVVASST